MGNWFQMMTVAATFMTTVSLVLPAHAADEPLKVFVAKKIITMDPGLPVATAVAVRGDRIAAVGDLADLEAWTENFPHTIDRTFED